MQPLRVLLADDHAAVRRSIRITLEEHGCCVVCCESANGRDAVRGARTEQPDIALLDVSMPEINGLDATREIVRDSPHTRIFLLTTHQSEELEDEARKAGAEAVVLKSDPEQLDAVLTAIQNGAMQQIAIHLGASIVRTRRHIGAFFSSDSERYEVMRPFVLEGVERGDRSFHIVDAAEHDAHRRFFDGHGERLDLASWDDMYLDGGRFDQYAMLRKIEIALSGATLTRLVAKMEWALRDAPGVDDLVEYESRLNYMLADTKDVVACTYDLSRFDGRTIVDVMRAHPAVIVAGKLHDNPFYTPPDEMIASIHQRRARV